MKTHITGLSKMLWVVVIVPVLLSACNRNASTMLETKADNPANTDEVKLSAEQMKSAHIVLDKVETKMMSHIIMANGVLDVPPQGKISISASVGGFVISIKLLPGMQVKKGEVLAVLQHADYIQMQQEYLETKSKLTYAKVEYERQKTLGKESINAVKNVQQSASEYNILQARFNALTQQLLLLKINMNALNKGEITGTINLYSPVNGFVTDVNVNTGKFCTPADVMLELVNLDDMHAQITLFEKDLPFVQEGQLVNISIPNKDEKFPAKLKLVGKSVDADKTIKLHAHFLKISKNFVPGMYVRAEIETEKSNALVVPENAIASTKNKNYVFTPISKNTFQRVEVEVGNSANGFVEIRFPKPFDAENEGKQFVTNGAYALLSQMLNSPDE